MTTGTYEVKITRKTHETPNIVSLELSPIDPLHPLPAFTAGAHIDVHLGDKLTRQYSLCNTPSPKGSYEIGVLRDPKSRGGSVAVHRLNEGDILKIGAPRNLFPLNEKADECVLLAGGIGVTPLLSMAETLAQTNKPFTFHYFAKDRTAFAFMQRLSNEALKPVTILHPVEDSPDSIFNSTRDLPIYKEGREVYVCGPQGFIEAVCEGARQRGYPEETIKFEHFNAPERTGVSASEEPFEVELEGSGQVYQIPSDRTIAQVLLEAGADIEVSCEQGMCGTCLVDLINGEVDHRDIYQTDAEKAANERIALCCSRGKGRIVIDP